MKSNILNISRGLAYLVLYLGLYSFVLYGVYQTASGWVAVMGLMLIIMVEVSSHLVIKTHRDIKEIHTWIDSQANLNVEQHKLNTTQGLINVKHRDQIESILTVAKIDEIDRSEKAEEKKRALKSDKVILFSDKVK